MTSHTLHSAVMRRRFVRESTRLIRMPLHNLPLFASSRLE